MDYGYYQYYGRKNKSFYRGISMRLANCNIDVVTGEPQVVM